MNADIERMAREAGMAVFLDRQSVLPFEMALERFAQVVAKRCAEVVERLPVEFYASKPGEMQTQSQRAAYVAAIKKQFGVEEQKG